MNAMEQRITKIQISDLWAKSNPYKSLLVHMQQSGETAKILLTKSIFANSSENIASGLGISVEEAIR